MSKHAAMAGYAPPPNTMVKLERTAHIGAGAEAEAEAEQQEEEDDDDGGLVSHGRRNGSSRGSVTPAPGKMEGCGRVEWFER